MKYPKHRRKKQAPLRGPRDLHATFPDLLAIDAPELVAVADIAPGLFEDVFGPPAIEPTVAPEIEQRAVVFFSGYEKCHAEIRDCIEAYGPGVVDQATSDALQAWRDNR